MQTLRSGILTQHSQVENFETELKKWFNHPHLLTLNSATSGLTLALRLLNLPPRAEVLCSPLTCMATTCAALANNVTIKWVDVDDKTCNMDLDDLEKKISPNTKAILFVHWGGSPIDLDRLKKIAVNIPVVEDCAHSFGAEYKGKMVGTTGNISVFSFQAIKHLTTADGGLILLPNEHLYKRAKLLRWYGIDREVRSGSGRDFRLETDIEEWGYKFHMNDLNATIGLANLCSMKDNLARVRENALYYDKNLPFEKFGECKECKESKIELVQQTIGGKSAYWIYTIKILKDRESFIEFMFSRNVMVSQVHKRNDIHSCVNEFRCILPQLEKLDNQIICLPVGWWITNQQREYIVNCIKEWTGLKIIREILPTDSESYLSLLSQLHGVERKIDFSTRLTQIEKSDGCVYVLIKGKKLAATLKLVIEPKFYDNVARIEDVVTEKSERGNGHASALIKFAIEKAKESGCYKIVLDCKQELVSFYQKSCFACEGVQMVYRFIR
jgi:dTDP-4-amino-4,6-dideoxygalactose transaminase/GNAT superfamily N-acetyltransferase